MDGPEILTGLRDQLVQEVLSHIAPPPTPLDISRWVAMALLQKAIRRGHQQFALTSAATLLETTPDRLWRRLAVIAFEDVGVADLDTVGIVTAATTGKRFRSDIGGEWAVASHLVDRLVHASKCRAADDLLMVAERHPAYAQARLDLTHATLPELLHAASGNGPLPERALALWYSVGTDRCPSSYLRPRKGAPHAVFDTLCEAGYPHSVVEIAREGFRRTSEVLCAFLPLLVTFSPADTPTSVDDVFPPETQCRAVPSWGIDAFSREGLSALRRFLSRDCRTSRWMREHVPSSRRLALLGNILFAVEGGLLKNRWRWSLAEKLRREAETECQGPHCPDATEIISLLRSDIGLLNEERRHV